MPLSDRDRVERQVLRHLIFHARSPVRLRADEESCRAFDCDGVRELAFRLADMHEADLFRILPGQGPAGDVPGPPAPPSDRPRRSERRSRVEQAFLHGLSVMVTSEGIQHFTRLRRKTSEVRLSDWQKREPARDAGGWSRGERPEA
jgi:hypothetical protein